MAVRLFYPRKGDIHYLRSFEYPLHDTFTRNVWIYKDANYELFNKKYLILIGHVFIKVLSMKQVHYLQIFLLNLLNFAYLVKLL